MTTGPLPPPGAQGRHVRRRVASRLAIFCGAYAVVTLTHALVR